MWTMRPSLRWIRYGLLALALVVIVLLLASGTPAGVYLAFIVLFGIASVTMRGKWPRPAIRSRHTSSLPPNAQLDSEARRDAMSRFAGRWRRPK
jgi:hypothetical protein